MRQRKIETPGAQPAAPANTEYTPAERETGSQREANGKPDGLQPGWHYDAERTGSKWYFVEG